jgi:ElaB/YqjD/DUF883 family membrane-anchored ribosome-binding protein
MDLKHEGAAQRAASGVKDKLGDIAAEAAKTAVTSNLDEAAAMVEDRYGALLDPAAEAIGCVVGFVRKQPLTSMVLAIAAGFTLARL